MANFETFYWGISSGHKPLIFEACRLVNQLYNHQFCVLLIITFSQEQLQINLLQQTHLNSSSGGKSNLHALQQQQHQLMAQIQLTQQALMLGQNLDSADHQFQIKTDILNKKDRERHASEDVKTWDNQHLMKPMVKQ